MEDDLGRLGARLAFLKRSGLLCLELLLLLDLLDVGRHAQDAELGQLGRTQESVGGLLLLLLLLGPFVELVYVAAGHDAMMLLLDIVCVMLIVIVDHLLVGHDVLHDQIFVLFSNGLVQFLLVLADQLLYVHIIVGSRLLLLQTKRTLGHSRQS